MWHSIHSTCLPAPVVAFFPTSSSATFPSVPLRSIPAAATCCCNASETDVCLPSPSGTMCARFDSTTPTQDHSSSHSWRELGNSPSAAASPARTSPLLAKVPGFLALAQVYGQSSPVLLAKYDPATHSLKTPQRCLFEDSTASLQTLPHWGWMRSGVVWGLMTSGPGIGGNGRGYLPTATSHSQAQLRSDPTPGQTGGNTLKGVVMAATGYWKRHTMFPTSKARDFQRAGGNRAHQSLPAVLHRGQTLFPTPTASMQTMSDLFQAQYAGNDPHRPTYATASARDWRSGKASQETMMRNSRPLNEQVTAVLAGSLNPTWECWYMGWPEDWEALPGRARPFLRPWSSCGGSWSTASHSTHYGTR